MKDLIWLGDSLENLKNFPEDVKDKVGYCLHQVQIGKKPVKAKPLAGVKPAVMEIVSDFDGNTYRSVYTVKIGTVVYVLHCFQKKSKQGIETPKQEIELIKKRLKEAEKIDQGD
jgi:phage-related protein